MIDGHARSDPASNLGALVGPPHVHHVALAVVELGLRAGSRLGCGGQRLVLAQLEMGPLRRLAHLVRALELRRWGPTRSAACRSGRHS